MNYQILQGDCLQVMRGMADNSVTVVISDPPYVVKDSVQIGGTGIAPRRIESSTIGDQEWYYGKDWISDAARLCPGHMVIFGNYLDLPELLKPRGQGDLRGVFVWRKSNAALPAWNVPRYDTEFAVWFGRGNNPSNIRSLKSMVFDYPFPQAGCFASERELLPGTSQAAHPAQKPLKLMREIVRAFSNPDDIIFDPFMGTGTTGVAALKEGRGFVGIERDPGYFAIAKRRIEQAAAQPLLLQAL